MLSFAIFAAGRQPQAYSIGKALRSQSAEEITRALLTIVGLQFQFVRDRVSAALWPRVRIQDRVSATLEFSLAVERHLFQINPALQEPAIWAWAVIHRSSSGKPSAQAMDRLLSLWLNPVNEEEDSFACFALSTQLGRPRNIWTPVLTVAQKQLVRQVAVERGNLSREPAASLMVAFHARDVLPEEELAKRLVALRESIPRIAGNETSIDAMLEQMGEAGQKYLRSRADQRQKRK